MSESLYKILPNLACNPISSIAEGATSAGLLNIVFPNGGAMLSWFKGLNEQSMKKLSMFSKFKGPDLNLDKTINSPIGLPRIQGITENRSR